MIINAIVAIVGITVGGLISNHVTKAELQSKVAEEVGNQCSSYVAQTAGSLESDATLKVCPSGIIYRSNSMGNEHFVPWRKVDAWQPSGLGNEGTHDGGNEYLDLRIVESTGFPFIQTHRAFKIYGPRTDLEKVVESRNGYSST